MVLNLNQPRELTGADVGCWLNRRRPLADYVYGLNAVLKIVNGGSRCACGGVLQELIITNVAQECSPEF